MENEPDRVEQEPAADGGAALGGGCIAGAVVVGGFFKMKEQKRKANAGGKAVEMKKTGAGVV